MSKVKSSLTSILFDLDGTLLDTAPDFTVILNNLLTKHNRPTISAANIRKTVSDGARALIDLGFNSAGTYDSIDNQQMLEAFLKQYHKQIEQTQSVLFNGIEELLIKIDEHKLQWGIVTNKPYAYTAPLLSHFPLLQSANCVICPEHLTLAKPDPEGLFLACDQISCLPTQSLYIGDHPRDIQAGINANMSTIAVDWGYYNDETPIELWGADKVVSKPEQILNFILAPNQ